MKTSKLVNYRVTFYDFMENELYVKYFLAFDSKQLMRDVAWEVKTSSKAKALGVHTYQFELVTKNQ